MPIKIPRNVAKSRNEKIIEMCKNKKVLHIGATNAPYTIKKYGHKIGPLLYREIDNVCKHQLGIDIDKKGIKFLSDKGAEFEKSEMKYFDMNNLENLDYAPDVIVFGETIEHVFNIKIALDNLKKVMGKETLLIISTPNAYSLFPWAGNLIGYEFFNPDHKLIYTYGLLNNALTMLGFNVHKFYFCKLDAKSGKIKYLVDNLLYYTFYKLFPQFYYNLLFIVKIK